MPKKVLLLNDTDQGGMHFGCARVMRTIRQELARRGMAVLPSIKVGTNWQRDQELVGMIDEADLVVINGEGTLHHGKRRGRWLLEAGARVKARGGRVALINALWQENPHDWADLAQEFDILAFRDSRSAHDVAAATRRQVLCQGDLSMLHTWRDTGSPRTGVMIGCSVHGSVTEHLARFAKEGSHDFVPLTISIKAAAARTPGWRHRLGEWRANRQNLNFLARFPRTRLVTDDDSYLAQLSEHSLLVSGRFHAVCLALLSGTPFLAVSSNSWKIETLIKDIGLDPTRLRPIKSLTQATLTTRDWSYSAAERAAIAERLGQWRAKGAALFDQIAALGALPTGTA